MDDLQLTLAQDDPHPGYSSNVRETKQHDVRSWSYLYREMINGKKKHDLRLNDRDYRVGDFMLAREFDQQRGVETGRCAMFKITYITGRDTVPCAVSTAVLPDDYCILSVHLDHIIK